MKNLAQNFFKTIDLLLDKLNSNDRETVKKNLTGAFWLAFFAKAANDPKNKEIFQKFFSKEISSYEEFEKTVNEAEEYFKDSDFDMDKAIKESMSEVILDFVSQFKNQFPEEKIKDLQEIVQNNLS